MDLMEKNGVNPKTDLKIKFGRFPINCLMDVADRKADVTAVPKGLWAKAEKMVKKEDLKVIGETDPVPQLPIIARPGLDPELVKKVQDALFALKPGHPDYEAVYKANKNFNGVVPAKDSDFDQTRRLMAKWLDEPFPESRRARQRSPAARDRREISSTIRLAVNCSKSRSAGAAAA